MTSFSSGVAKTKDVDLYFERRGSGPPLVMIAGGGGDCGFYNDSATLLSENYTVMTYDRRGNSRSPLHGNPVITTVAEQSEDAVAVVRANGFESALVFGTSGGAIVALDLAANHPGAVTAVVPYEPALPRVLPEGEGIIAAYREINGILEAEGWEPAFKRFLTFNRLVPPDDPVALMAVLDPAKLLPPGPLLDLLARQSANWPYMMKYEVWSFVNYMPDLDRIASERIRIALAGGDSTRGMYYREAGSVIAQGVGAQFVEFHGGHSAAVENPVEFAPKLHGVFESLGRADDQRQ